MFKFNENAQKRGAESQNLNPKSLKQIEFLFRNNPKRALNDFQKAVEKKPSVIPVMEMMGMVPGGQKESSGKVPLWCK